jgi:hypothetical protein
MDVIRYPIGTYIEQPFSDQQLKEWLLDVRFLPNHLEHSINNLDEFQLKTSYREGGWSILQIVHHLADSHMNAFIRTKLALTEDNPIIKPYDQDSWAETPEIFSTPVNVSITLLHALHLRWYELLKGLSTSQWERAIVHPEYNMQMTIWYILGKYAWHSKHHVAQINALRERKVW